MKVYKNRWFSRFASKEKITNADLLDAIHRAEEGLIDADLGSGIIKQRIARQGKGRSKGYRSIILYKAANKAFFVFGFAKNKSDNIRTDELKSFKEMASHIFELSDEQILQLITNEQLIEVNEYE